MIVRIIDTKTENGVIDVPVVLKGMNYSPADQEYFSVAWKCAVDDGSVDPKRKSDYAFQLLSA